MRRMPSGFVSAVVAVVLALVTAAACGGGGGKPSHPAATTADVPVTVAHGATVRLAGGTTLVIPPGAVSADGRLIAHAGGSQVGANLGLDGRPGAAKPVFASAGSAVTFELTGAKLVRSAVLTVQVDPATLAQAGTAASRPDAAWLAFYDATAHRWQHVDSRYDPAAHSVTAQVLHLSTWNPFTWDWAGITLRLRQSLSAFGSGRAPVTGCPKVQGISLTTAGANDPPLIACITGDAASGFKVQLTNNRAYSAILQAPPGLTQEPRDFAGFEEFVHSSDSVTKALGGPYLASLGTVTYRLPAAGTTFVFKDAASVRTVVLDWGIATSEAVFDTVTLGYAKCVLDNAAHSGAASLNEAPGLITECFPGLNLLVEWLGVLQALQSKVANILASYDTLLDAVMKVHGEVDITPTPPQPLPTCPNITPPVPAVVIGPGCAKPTVLYFSSDQTVSIQGITWSSWTVSGATGHGTWNLVDCNPNCAQGPITTYPATLTLSNLQNGLYTVLITTGNGPTTTWNYPDNWPQHT